MAVLQLLPRGAPSRNAGAFSSHRRKRIRRQRVLSRLPHLLHRIRWPQGSSPGVSSALHQIFHRSNWNWCEDPPRIDPVGLGQILWILPTTPADPERIPAAKKMDVNPVTVLISQLRSIIETIDVLMSKHAYAALTTSTPYRVDRHAHLHPHLKNYSNNYEDGEYNMGGFYSNQILTEADAEHQEYIKTMQLSAHAHMDIFHRMFSRISRTPIPR